MSSVLNQAYKGKMFSFLTKSPDPYYPLNLQTLARSKVKVMTCTGMLHRGVWKAAILVNLEETMTAAEENGAGFPSYYKFFSESIEYLGEWLNGLREFTSRIYAQTHIKLNSNEIYEWERYPEEFAVLEPMKHVHMQKIVLNLFTPEKWVSPAVPISTFMTTMPWTVDRGYFYPLFKNALGSLFESGLYDRWDRFHDDINGVDNFHSVAWRLKEKGLNVSAIEFPVEEKHWNGYYFGSEKHRKMGLNEDVGPISSSVLTAMWVFAGSLFFASVLTFLVEVFTKWKCTNSSQRAEQLVNINWRRMFNLFNVICRTSSNKKRMMFSFKSNYVHFLSHKSSQVPRV